MQQESRIQQYLSRGIGSIADPWLQTQFSQLTAQDRPRGVRDMEIDDINTETVSSMITESIAMIVIECPRLPKEWVVCASAT